MTLQELQKQVLQLPMSDRWQLVQTVLESITNSIVKSGCSGNRNITLTVARPFLIIPVITDNHAPFLH